MILSIFLIIVGFALLIVGADALVEGASGVAKKFHIPEIIIGLTIVSIGTSMPELFVSITSALDGYSDMAIGNVVGSNICNLLLILGLSAIMKPVEFQKETKLYEIPMCLFTTLVFMFFCNTENLISFVEALALIILFCMFIYYTIYMARKESEDIAKNESDTKSTSVFRDIIYILLGIIGLKFGGDLSVENAENVAIMLGISEKIISLTVLAVGTSLPELVTSITAAIKCDSDIAIGNIIGSNIFNILLIIGTSALIKPITYNVSYNFDCIVLIIATIMLSLFPIIPPKDKMSRRNGILYMLMYGVYLTILFVK